MNTRAKYLLSTDSNQQIHIKLAPSSADPDRLVGEDTVRFENDQSDDSSLSLHGLRIQASYSAGNGVKLIASILNYAGKNAKADAKVVAMLGASVPFEMTEEQTRTVNFTHLNSALAGSWQGMEEISIADLVRQGKLKNGDLFHISVPFCRYTGFTQSLK